MIYGKNQAEILHLNGWSVGDILEGDYVCGSQRIKITGIGEELFLYRWLYKTGWSDESINTIWNLKEWKKVGNIHDSLSSGDSDTIITVSGQFIAITKED